MELRTYLRVVFRYWWLVLIVLVIAVGCTAWFTFSQEPIYESSATYIVRPALSAEDAKSELSGLDVLGRQGDIASTFAEMANSRQIKDRAAERLGISSSQRRSLSVDSQLVAGTYLLKITVQGPDPELISQFANMVGAATVTFVEELYVTYELVSLDPATAPSLPSRPNRILNLALGAALGLVLGAGLAFLAYYLQSPLDATASYATSPQAVPGRAVPAQMPASYAVAAEAVASDAEAEGEAIAAPAEMLGEPVSGRRAAAPGSIAGRRSLLGWIGAAILTLMLIVGASVVWFSGRDTSAASLPTDTPGVAVAMTDTWTPTVTILATETATTTEVLSVTATLAPSATPTTEPSATLAAEPSATPSTESSGTPSVVPSATPSMEPTATPTTEPSATATSSPTSSPTAVPSRTPTRTPRPTPRPTQAAATPTSAAATGTLLRAPVLLSPLDKQDFPPDAEIVLAWQPAGTLAADAYYAITVSYSHLGETWFDDVPWTRNTSWTLTEHAYLQDLSDNGQYRWSVQVVRQTGTDANGKPTGVPLSAQSEVRLLTWRKESGGGGGGGGASTPVPPPP
jgi:capsular polysaccharide biosynthesis protein